jgi:hypothetical protein
MALGFRSRDTNQDCEMIRWAAVTTTQSNLKQNREE